MKKLFLIPVILLLTCLACKKKEDQGPVITVKTPPPTMADTIGQGAFTSYDHGLSGKAIFYQEGTTKTLRLYDYNMSAGPDVHVYLSKTSSYSAANVIEITKLTTGYVNSSLNLDVSSSVYTVDYKYVLVYCVQYSSLFGYTELE
jgi:hypothetical protein